jgi:hypothetical protein
MGPVRSAATGREAVLRQQLDILGEHGEQAAHQEHRHVFRVVTLLFQCLRHRGQTLGDGARHPRGLPRRVQLHRIGPDARQPIANVLPPQILHVDTKGLTIGELRVVLPLAGEVGIDLDHVAHVAHQDERRPAMRDW